MEIQCTYSTLIYSSLKDLEWSKDLLHLTLLTKHNGTIFLYFSTWIILWLVMLFIMHIFIFFEKKSFAVQNLLNKKYYIKKNHFKYQFFYLIATFFQGWCQKKNFNNVNEHFVKTAHNLWTKNITSHERNI